MLSIDSFKIVAVLGRGFFGKVMLVRSKQDGALWALKTVHKMRLVQSEKVHTILAERNILSRMAHPFIVTLRFAFQSATKFYLGMEYIPGGDLSTLLARRGPLPLAQARLYIAEIALAIAHLHSVEIVYRDLKPENVLIDTDGHAKLTDFGLAKDLTRLRCTSTFCGTADYMAPETVEKQTYGFPVDWWGLGVLTYTLLFGYAPFHHENRANLYRNISVKDPVFPESAAPPVMDFIKQLLTKNPKHRPTFEGIEHHQFWGGISFDDVREKRIPAEYIPQIDDAASPSHFDSKFTDEPAIDSLATPAIGDRTVFADFTFVFGENEGQKAMEYRMATRMFQPVPPI
jgi:serine/threonine protein kinase